MPEIWTDQPPVEGVLRSDIAALLEDAAQQRTAGYFKLAKHTLTRVARLRRHLVQLSAKEEG